MVRLANDVGWGAVTLDAIAAEAEIGLDKLQAMFPSRAAIVAGFMADVDHDMLGRLDSGESHYAVRDRLFAVLMARLDALRPHRDAVVAMLRGALGDPVTACALATTSRRSLSWMLAAAGTAHTGIDGELKMQGLGALYASTLWVWARDTSEDMSATMAHVDRQLRRAESIFQFLQRSVRVPRRSTRKPARA